MKIVNSTFSRARRGKIILILSASLVGGILFVAGAVYAIGAIASGWRVDSNTTTIIDATSIGGDCRSVVMPNNGINRFVPTKTLAEWNNFKAAAPGLGITLNGCTTCPSGYYGDSSSGYCYSPLRGPIGWRAAWDDCYSVGASIVNGIIYSSTSPICGISGGCSPITGAYKIVWWGPVTRDMYSVRSCNSIGCPEGAGDYSVDTYATNPFPQTFITNGLSTTDVADGTHYYWCEIPANSTYSWVSGVWGSCSVTCGGGTQTRTVSCVRNDGQPAADTNCTTAKPATSQSCNTQACGSAGYTVCKGSPTKYLPSVASMFTVAQGDNICSTAYGAGYVWARYRDMDQTYDTNMWNNNQLYVNWARANGSPSSCLASWDTTHRIFMNFIPLSTSGVGLHFIDAFNTSGLVDQTDLSTGSMGSPASDTSNPPPTMCSGARPTTLPLVCCK